MLQQFLLLTEFFLPLSFLLDVELLFCWLGGGCFLCGCRSSTRRRWCFFLGDCFLRLERHDRFARNIAGRPSCLLGFDLEIVTNRFDGIDGRFRRQLLDDGSLVIRLGKERRCLNHFVPPWRERFWRLGLHWRCSWLRWRHKLQGRSRLGAGLEGNGRRFLRARKWL